METITGVVTNVRTARHTHYGNPIKAVTVLTERINAEFETMPNAQLGYGIGNFLGKAVTVTLRDYRGKPRIYSVELVGIEEHPADCGYCESGEPSEHNYEPMA